MKYKIVFASIAFALLLTMVPLVRAPTQNGPRTDTLYWKIFYDPGAEWNALKTGTIDMMDWTISKSQYDEWAGDPALKAAINVEETKDLGMFEFDFNCNDTVDGLAGATYTYPGIPNPTADAAFRRAISRLVDKVAIATQDFAGILEIMDVPMPKPVQERYINATTVAEWRTGALSYNPAAAVAALDAAGYVQGATANPNYDSTKPWSSPKIRVNPYHVVGGVKQNLYELIFYIRADKTDRTAAGLRFTDMLRKAGIPVKSLVVDRTTTYPQTMIYFGYNIYTGGWGLGRDPDHLHDFYTGEFYNPQDYNYMGCNAWYEAGVGPHIKSQAIEDTLDGIKYATTFNSMVSNAKKVQGDIFGSKGIVPSVILGNYVPSRTAYRSDWKGVVNVEGAGTSANFYTEINAYKPGATEMKIGQASTISSMNPVTAEWTWDWQLIGVLWDTLMGGDPYTLPNDMPNGLADWWKVDAVNDPAQGGKLVTKLTFHLRTNARWHTPDGSPGPLVTVNDIKFSINYHKEQMGWLYTNAMNVNHIETSAALNEIYVYMDVTAFLALHWVGSALTMLREDIWKNVPDAYVYNPHTDDFNHNGVIDAKEDGSGSYCFREYVTDDHTIMDANRNWYLTTGGDPGDWERYMMEAFHRRGDANYDAVVDTTDLAKISKAYSSIPYQTVRPTWHDDQYPNLMYSPAPGTDPYNTGMSPPFDWIGTITSGTNWYAPGGPHPWKAEDVNYDDTVDVTDLTILSKFWRYRAGSGW